MTRQTADALHKEHLDSGRSIRELVAENGVVTEEQLLEAQSAVSRLPIIRLYEQNIPMEVRNLVKGELLRNHIMMPFGFDPDDPGMLLVAVNDPMNIRARDMIAIATKCRVKPYLAATSDILVNIDRYYGNEEMREAAELYTRDTELDVSVEDEIIREDIQRYEAEIAQLQDTLKILDYKPWYYQTALEAGTCNFEPC